MTSRRCYPTISACSTASTSMNNGDILATDWVSGSLFQWNKKMGMKKLATGFKGPADFCVVPNKKGLLVAVPDLVKGEIRFVQLGK